MTKHSKKNKTGILYLLSCQNPIFFSSYHNKILFSLKQLFSLLLLSNSLHTNSLDFNFVHGVAGHKITVAPPYY